MQRLAGRIAQITVSVFQRDDLDPSDYADPFPDDARSEDVWFWLLRDGFYTLQRGIDLAGTGHGDDSWGIIL